MKNYIVALASLALAVVLFAQAPGAVPGPAPAQTAAPSAAQQSLP